MVLGDPTGSFRTSSRKRRIETADEPVLAFHLWIRRGTVLQRGKHDLGSKRQRGDDGPRRQRAVVRTIGHPSRPVAEEAPRHAFHAARRRSRAVARRDAPDVLAVVAKVPRIPHRVLLVHVRRAAAVLEVVDGMPPHERILYPAEVDP